MGEAVKEIVSLIKELPNSWLYLIGTFLVNSMLWFMSIFLFHKGFYELNHIMIVLLFTISLALIWTVCYVFIGTLLASYSGKVKMEEQSVAVLYGALLSVGILFLGIVDTYSTRSEIETGYSDFLLFLQFFSAGLFLYGGAYYFINFFKQKKAKLLKFAPLIKLYEKVRSLHDQTTLSLIELQMSILDNYEKLNTLNPDSEEALKLSELIKIADAKIDLLMANQNNLKERLKSLEAEFNQE